MARYGCRSASNAKFFPALRCLIRPWRALEPWITDDDEVERTSHYALARLGDVLTRQVLPIDKAKRPLDNLNVIAKVTFGGALHVRSEQAKKAYKGPLFEALPGQLVISKIRVGQGSFCVLGTEHDHLAVSPEYPVYAPQTDIVDPDYLALVLRTSAFMKRLAGSASGNTTKRRIRPSFFESLAIPLPPLDEQKALVAAQKAALLAAEAAEAEALRVENEGMDAFADALGVSAPPPLPDRPVFIARFRDLDRWAFEAVLRRVTVGKVVEAKWPLVRASDVGKITYGLQKHPGNRPNVSPRPYLRVANVQRNYLDLSEIKLIEVSASEMERYRLLDGDLLLCEGNSPDLVGRGAIWRSEIDNCVHQNHILRVRLDQAKASPEFVLAAINSDYGKAYFRAQSKQTTNLASINSKEVAAFAFPLPPLETQQELVAELARARAAADCFRQEAEAKRAEARRAFEAAVYVSEAPNDIP